MYSELCTSPWAWLVGGRSVWVHTATVHQLGSANIEEKNVRPLCGEYLCLVYKVNKHGIGIHQAVLCKFWSASANFAQPATMMTERQPLSRSGPRCIFLVVMSWLNDCQSASHESHTSKWLLGTLRRCVSSQSMLVGYQSEYAGWLLPWHAEECWLWVVGLHWVHICIVI